MPPSASPLFVLLLPSSSSSDVSLSESSFLLFQSAPLLCEDLRPSASVLPSAELHCIKSSPS
eukprot:7557373-Karenia_brevis.AAC.1